MLVLSYLLTCAACCYITGDVQFAEAFLSMGCWVHLSILALYAHLSSPAAIVLGSSIASGGK